MCMSEDLLTIGLLLLDYGRAHCGPMDAHIGTSGANTMFRFCPQNPWKTGVINLNETIERQCQPIDAHTSPCYPSCIRYMESVSPNRGRLEWRRTFLRFCPPGWLV